MPTTNIFLAVPNSSGLVSAGGNKSSPTDQTTVVILSSVLSVAGVVALTGLVFICCRLRQRQMGLFFPRGSSPIDDDEIEAWKGNREQPTMDEPEKSPSGVSYTSFGDNNEPVSPPLLSADFLGAGATVQRQDPLASVQSFADRAARLDSPGSDRGSMVPSNPSPKKRSSNVIIYKDTPQPCPVTPKLATLNRETFTRPGTAPAETDNRRFHHGSYQQQETVPLYRRSEEFTRRSSRSASFGYPAYYGMAGRFSLDQDREVIFPPTLASMQSPRMALQYARAPNSRAGLTDESVPGDPSFLPAPKRLPSRLSKMPPATGSPLVTAAATAAAVIGDAGARSVPRWIPSGDDEISPVPSPPGNTRGADANIRRNSKVSVAFRRARSRSTRSCSIVSYVGPEPVLQTHTDRLSFERSPSVPRYRSTVQPRLQPSHRQSPALVSYQHMPAYPLPASMKPGRRNNSGENSDYRGIYRYQCYNDQGKQPRPEQPAFFATPVSSSTLSPSSSLSISSHMRASATAVRASIDSDVPLLGGLPPPRASERGGSHEYLDSIGLAIG
ncbi:hypothetical protein SEPCBS57363_005908 [Sporothrix epigloea]|uniref:Uncharacterized protein n=1 Tax=Sporothrix epigloea TaxID=1892477 RepID=A0ABP0E2I6_9PEZI